MLVGIDLGTTHSLIGRYGPNGPELAPNALGEMLTPSVVSIDEAGHLLVGQAAKDRLITHPGQTVAAFKRWMGSNRTTQLGVHNFTPEELSALVLRSLVADAEAHFGEPVNEAVISVPAYFSDAQRKATRTAGEMAGLKVERLINEPTAAALAYGLMEGHEEARVLVFDLGGGTLDVSVLEMFEGVIDIHASAGDNFLGGEDFLDALLTAACKELEIDLELLSPDVLAQLERRLEAAKRELTQKSEVLVSLPIAIGDRANDGWLITQDRFVTICEPLIQRMRQPVERAMRDAELQPGDLNEIILVGGASRMPMVAQTLTRMVGRLPLRHVNPDLAIALGVSIAAGMKARDARLEETVLTDICPYTLGTEVAKTSSDGQHFSGYFLPIIPRNTTVPVSREVSVFPLYDGQKEMKIEIFQGESPWVKNNIRLGRITVALPPSAQRGDSGVDLRYTYDIDGLLQVEAKEQWTSKVHSLVLQQSEHQLSEAEVQERLKKLAAIKVHPRAQQANLAVMARAERAYMESIHDREEIQHWMSMFQQLLETQDLKRIESARKELNQRLTGVEANL
ncbi:molecular chaperone HscC [Hydrogenophaga sp. 5NK40-0174]|uniref:molecular chaperone HscC n=1 Tax=Hydrogenophaga sp. 5NK40-0174 TaxID=3127649 RepID=UPI00310ABDF2